MSKKEIKKDSENTEKRERVRLNEYRPISVEDLKAGLLHRAIMLNQSKTGMYFESDSLLQPGARIYLATQKSSEASLASEFECRLAEIVWRNRLKKSFYKRDLLLLTLRVKGCGRNSEYVHSLCMGITLC